MPPDSTGQANWSLTRPKESWRGILARSDSRRAAWGLMPGSCLWVIPFFPFFPLRQAASFPWAAACGGFVFRLRRDSAFQSFVYYGKFGYLCKIFSRGRASPQHSSSRKQGLALRSACTLTSGKVSFFVRARLEVHDSAERVRDGRVSVAMGSLKKEEK